MHTEKSKGNNFTEAVKTVEVREFSKARKLGQDTKGVRGMPWCQEAKKDVASCEKLRGAASEHRSVDIRMGEPNTCEQVLSLPEYIGQ